MAAGIKCARTSAGRLEEELKFLIRDMTTAGNSVLASRGILISDRERIELQKAINEHVSSSIEIRAAMIAIIERGEGPEAA